VLRPGIRQRSLFGSDRPPTPTLPHKAGGSQNSRWLKIFQLIQRYWGQAVVESAGRGRKRQTTAVDPMAASKRKGLMTMRSFRSFRSSIAATIGVMLVAALGVAAMRLASELLAGIMFLLTCGLLCLAFIAVFYRDSAERAWWLGFTVFGWIHHGLAFGWWWGEVRPWLPTTRVLEMLGMATGLTVDRSRPLGFGEPWRPFLTAGQSLWTLLMAVTGGIVALLLVGDRTGKSEGGAAEPPTNVVALRRWWTGPVIVYAGGCGLAMALAIFCSGTVPGIWAGATFLVAWVLIGLAGTEDSYRREADPYLIAGSRSWP
jgi:hypothetical protein